MKTTLLLTALLLTSVAQAQVDKTEIVLTFLMIASGSEEDPDQGMEFLKGTGISDAGAEALVVYAIRARNDLNEMGYAHGQALCRDKESLRAREALARRMESNIAEERAYWKGLDDDLGTVLSVEDEAIVRNWIDQEFDPSFGPNIDVANEIRKGKLDPDAILARACEFRAAPPPIRSPEVVQKTAKAEPPRLLRQAPPLPPGAPRLIKLEPPPMYSGCDAWAINNAGVIVGFCWKKDPMFGFPVRWDHGTGKVLTGPLRSIGSAETDDQLPISGGLAVGINDAGHIAGTLYLGNPAKTARAAIWDEHGYWRDLGLPDLGLPAEHKAATARGINSTGDVVGTSGGHAVVFWRYKGIEILPKPTEASRCNGFAINSGGQAVGACTAAPTGEGFGEVTAVLWRDQTAVELSNPCGAGETNIGTYARTISDSGMIGGTAGHCAMVWQASTPRAGIKVADQGVVNSINKRGELVGFLGTYGASPTARAAMWTSREVAALDLAIPADATGVVRAINDQGTFVGVVYPGKGSPYAFVSQ